MFFFVISQLFDAVDYSNYAFWFLKLYFSDSSIVSIKYFKFIYFNRRNRGHGTSPHSLLTHPASEQCHLLSIVGGPFFKFATFRT